MSSITLPLPRAARWDALMVALAFMQVPMLLAFPSAPAIALVVWWNSNTIAHNFLHRPFFRSRAANRLFAAWLTALLGIPQSLWRDRHLAHHAGVRPRIRYSHEFFLQTALVLALWSSLAARAPRFFLAVYLPGYLAGLGLCALHGHYEHARGVTSGVISHYGALYNLLCFNDGYHAEHHADPRLHWTRLPGHIEPAHTSPWPAPLRFLEAFSFQGSLEGLERLVLRSPALQRFVLRTHTRALRRLVRELPPIDRIAVVGGGLYPRTALILARLFPAARITIVDARSENLARARAILRRPDIDFVHARFAPPHAPACDLLVIPLAFDGNRAAIYAHPPAPAVLVHDWIWRRRGLSATVSWALLKRINLVVTRRTPRSNGTEVARQAEGLPHLRSAGSGRLTIARRLATCPTSREPQPCAP